MYLIGMKLWRFGASLYDCPCVLTMDRLRGRWKTTILWHIWVGNNRFNAICRELPHVNRGVIARQIRSMERDGLIDRTVRREKPLHVEYDLTALGRSLSPILASLAEWGASHGEAVMR